jgi:glycosyltransferase involved in cell wall biosynthesis
VHDDSSTDGTADIIKKYERSYPDKVKSIIQSENKYSKGVRTIMASFMMPKARGQYLAICEGDDFWIDERKLEHQTLLLDGDSEIGMCYSRVIKYIQQRGEFDKEWGGPATQFTDLLNNNVIPTPTSFFRKELYAQYISEVRPQDHQWALGDYPTWLWFALRSRITFMPEVTACYRVLSESMSHFKDMTKKEVFVRSAFDIKKFFVRLGALPINVARIDDDMNRTLANIGLYTSDKVRFVKYYLLIRKVKPKDWLKRLIVEFKLLNKAFLKIKLKRG